MGKGKQIKRTLLVQTKGREDKAWCHVLKQHFADTDLISVTLDPGIGGSPVDIVRAAINKKNLFSSSYDHVVALVDGDYPEDLESAKRLARDNNIELFVIAPRMEALLLNILEPEYFWYSTDVGHKDYFEHTYIKPDERIRSSRYEKVLSLEAILTSSQTDAQLMRLIELMRGENWG